MFWNEKQERKYKIELLAANIFARAVTHTEYSGNKYLEAKMAFELAEAFLEELESRTK